MLNGIDISHWQKNINLDVVPCDFVICKATEGTTFVDSTCDRFYQQAKKNGKLLGVYHYADGGDVHKEADFFINNCKNYIGEAILILDWESKGNASFGKNDFNWVKTWLDYVHAKTGVKPMLYISKSIMNKFTGIGDYGLWVAQYANYNPTGYQEKPWNEGAYKCAMRQYTSSGRLNGYDGNLDLNKFYGDASAWRKYAFSYAHVTTNPVTPTKKSVDEIAKEVIAGKWGDGDTRKKRLEASGYNYSEVQNKVNALLGVGKKAPTKKSVDEIAKEVIAGKWGDGDTRKKRLEASGYNYSEVQNKVNALLGVGKKALTKSVYHTVKYGETLSGIATKYGTTYQHLAKINGISNPNLIHSGQRIKIR